jgi:dATP pyrophosphohydrolase
VSVANQFKRPESVLIVVYTQASDVLVLRRCQPPDFWQSVTGSLEWHEDAFTAAQRELKEETALDANLELIDCKTTNRFPIHPAWQARYGDARENTEYVFRLILPSQVSILLNPLEHSKYVWLPKAQAAAKVTSYTNRHAIEQFVPSRPC